MKWRWQLRRRCWHRRKTTIVARSNGPATGRTAFRARYFLATRFPSPPPATVHLPIQERVEIRADLQARAVEGAARADPRRRGRIEDAGDDERPAAAPVANGDITRVGHRPGRGAFAASAAEHRGQFTIGCVGPRWSSPSRSVAPLDGSLSGSVFPRGRE